jgi:hypothetical protein
MRVEKTYPGAVIVEHDRLRGTAARWPATIRYYTTGETPPVSTCYCTFCGKPTRLKRPGPLPPCSSCDNTEFAAEPDPISPPDAAAQGYLVQKQPVDDLAAQVAAGDE